MTSQPAIPRLGLAFVPTKLPEHLVPTARAVEAAGLDDLWVWEDCFAESGIAPAVAALASTTRIRVAIGLLPVPLRNVALVAMEVATIDRMFPGRFVTGIGHGVQSWMGQVGARPRSPLTLLREYADALRRLLAGERVSVSGDYVTLDDVALTWPPDTAPALYLGGAGPKTLALSAELGDSTMLTSPLGEAEIAAACAIVQATPHRDAAHGIVASLITTTGPDARARLEAELEIWGTAPGSAGVAGDASEIADAVRRLAALGVTTVVFQATASEPDLAAFATFLGDEVAPLVRGA